MEHVFGFMEQSMHGLVFRGVGLVRAKANISFTNLINNLYRLVQIKQYHLELIKRCDNQCAVVFPSKNISKKEYENTTVLKNN